MNFPSILIDSGYMLAEKISIFMKPGYAGIAYSDGDTIENRIANIIAKAQDLSIFSRELAVQCTDWPSLYHLSGTRANILRPFHSILKQANVLEIGAGCGAITRYLGESGANVLALEGSPRRAAIARSRTRDLENVTVVADKFDQFQCDLRFDIITLIGVLEYAALFTDGENPVVSMLTRVRELLKPKGRLILAIENQLGLKYFAGAAEDHTGEPMLGIEGRYSTKGPRTFGRKALATKLQQAGFINQQFMAPFPDYKLPTSILTEQGFNCDTFDTAALCWQSVRRDPQLPSSLVFAPELAWSVVDANNLTLELANSFLVVAQTSIEAEHDNSILAYHYSTNGRHSRYCKEILFIQQSNDDIELIYNPLDSKLTRSEEGHFILFNIPYTAKYIYGKPLSLKLLQIVTRDNWHVREIGDFLQLYLTIIKSFLAKQDNPVDIESITSLLPGTCFDLIPQNIICLPDQTYQIFDQEWTLKDSMPIGWLLFRTLSQLMHNITRFGKQSTKVLGTYLDFFLASFESAGFTVTKNDLEFFLDMETQIQIIIHGYDNLSAPIFTWTLQTPFPNQSLDIARKDQKQILILKNKVDNLQIEKLRYETALNFIPKYLSNSEIVSQINCNQARSFSKRANLIARTKLTLDRFSQKNRYQLRQLIQLLEKIPLFDANYYCQLDPNIAKSKNNPIHHYFFHGVREGRNPNPYFFTFWYLTEYPDVASSGINPLLHFLLYGAQEGRNPNPYFLTRWYQKNYPEVQSSTQHPLLHYLNNYKNGIVKPNPYFDPAWYTQTYLSTNQNNSEPFAHFLQQHHNTSYNPNPHFDSQWYLRTYPWVERLGLNPLQHFISFSAQEKTNPNPYFDSQWYEEEYPESKTGEISAFAHYLSHIKDGGFNPNPYFDTDWYRSSYPDIIANDSDPLLHFILHGANEYRNPGPFFNTAWYLNKYPDVKESGMNPLLHFLEFGAFECRDPYPEFDTNWYLSNNPEILEDNLPPLLHYIQKRKKEGKLTHDPARVVNNKNLKYTYWRDLEYTRWHERLFGLTDVDRKIMKNHVNDFSYTPLLSVLMPVYNPPIKFFIDAIESIKNQIYSNWELCIADDASTDPEVKQILTRYSQEDPRIKVVFRNNNGHISKASNSALEIVSGEFFALLDHDDLLTEDALFWVVESLQRHPDADLIYSDEDKIDEKSVLQSPYFKPDWDPFLFLGQNFFSHLGVYRTSLVREIGGFRLGFEGSQDYDLVARCVEKISPNNIIHIPRVLYHWRIVEGSTASNINEKPYAQISAEKIINEHLKKININATAITNPEIGSMQSIVCNNNITFPLVTIIIPTRNNHYSIKNCIESIFRLTENISYEIIIVDNGSDEIETINYLKSLDSRKNVSIIHDNGQFNFSRLNNRAAKLAQGEVLILLNDDTEIINSDWLTELVQLTLLPDVGAVGAKLYYDDYTIQHAGVILGIGGCASHVYLGEPKTSDGYFANLHLLRGYSVVTAACLAVQTFKYWQVNGLDEDLFGVGYNDVDFCLKLNRYGYQNLWNPRAKLFHFESVSRGKDDTPEKQKRFWNEISILKKRWPHAFYNDAAYNPNLTLQNVHYTFADIPRVALNSQQWPRPFKPSFIPSNVEGLRILIAVDDNNDYKNSILIKLIRKLTDSGRVYSYAVIGPDRILHLSENNSGWFDIICLNNFPFKNKWFSKNIMNYYPYVVFLQKIDSINHLSKSSYNLAYNFLINSSIIITTDNDFSFILENTFSLSLSASTTTLVDYKNNSDVEIFSDALNQLVLANPLPACSLGLR